MQEELTIIAVGDIRRGTPFCWIYCRRYGHQKRAKDCTSCQALRKLARPSPADPTNMVVIARPSKQLKTQACSLWCPKGHRRDANYCRLCHNESSKRWQIANPEKFGATQQKQRHEAAANRARDPWFGRAKSHRTTPDALATMWQSQDRRCANKACGKPISPTTRDAAQANVDHDHGCCPGVTSCGRCIRGLLCKTCNCLLADAKLMRGLMEYATASVC